MPKHHIPKIPAGSILLAAIGLLATEVIAGAGGPNPGGSNNWCDGYCSSQKLSCTAPNMRCCCKVGGVWTCQCKLATDCTTWNDCQDGGGES